MMRTKGNGLLPLSAAAATVFTLISAGPAQAASPIYLQLSGMPTFHRDTDTGITAGGGSGPFNDILPGNESSLGYEFSLTAGAILFRHLLLGATYMNQKPISNQKNSGAATGDSSFSSTPTYESVLVHGWGPSAGLIVGGFHLIGTYFVSATRDGSIISNDGQGNITQYWNSIDTGKGMQIDIGYSFMLNSWLSIGPSLVYNWMTYSKQSFTDLGPTGDPDTSGLALNSTSRTADLYPMLNVVVQF